MASKHSRPYNSGAGGKRAADLLAMIEQVRQVSAEPKFELTSQPSLPSKGREFSMVRRLGALSANLAGRYAALYEILPTVLPEGSRILKPEEINFPLLPVKLAAGIAVDNAVSLESVESFYLQKLPPTVSDPFPAFVQGAIKSLLLKDQDNKAIGHRVVGFSLRCESVKPERQIFADLATTYRHGHVPPKRDLGLLDLHVAYAPNGEALPKDAIITACALIQEAIPVGSEFTLLPMESVWEGPPLRG